MTEISRLRIGFDIAKGVFQAHGVREEPGEPVAFVKRIKRGEVEKFFTRLPPSPGPLLAHPPTSWPRHGRAMLTAVRFRIGQARADWE